MKKLLTGLGLIALLAGCASHDNGNGMGGTSDDSNQSMKTDSYNNTSGSSDQHNNASNGTGSSAATNDNNSGQTMP